jgi:hypothetical protein
MVSKMLLNLPTREYGTEVSLVTERLGASMSSLPKVWDDEEGAICDQCSKDSLN